VNNCGLIKMRGYIMQKLLGLLFVSVALSCSSDLFAGKRKHKQHKNQQGVVSQTPIAPAEQQPSLLGNATNKVGELYLMALAGLRSGCRVSAQAAKAIKDFVVQHQLGIIRGTGVAIILAAILNYYLAGRMEDLCLSSCLNICGKNAVCSCTLPNFPLVWNNFDLKCL
jgi:hypothetical protein